VPDTVLRGNVFIECKNASRREDSCSLLCPVGERIVAEVLLELMFNDRHSLLTMKPRWTSRASD
jgi:hypothetical protein